MKALLHYPKWGNRWAPYIETELGCFYDLTVTDSLDGETLGAQSQDADLLISMWCNEATYFWSHYFPDKKIISYLRRYELWTPNLIGSINFDAVDAMIFVSEYYRSTFNDLLKENAPRRQYVIYNGVDVNAIPFRQETPKSKKIAFVCAVRDVKNFPLAFQILLSLPEDYTIHNICFSGDPLLVPQLLSYREVLGLQERFRFEGRVEPDKVYDWLSDKGFILSTSINEGNPNNVIEAMAMGIKPVIHAWPGATDQFATEWVFKTVDDAVKMITNSDYEPERYRKWVEDHYSLDNFRRIHKVIEDVWQ